VKTAAIAVSLLIVSAMPASAMTPKTAKFIREKCGLDPGSKEVRLADKDGVIHTTVLGDPADYSLDWLATQKRVNGVKNFIATRNYIHKLKADYAGTPYSEKEYDGIYLTAEERQLANRKFVETP